MLWLVRTVSCFAAYVQLTESPAVTTGSVLLLVLSFLLGAALFITSAYVGTLLAYRLWYHIFDKEGRGVEAWARESAVRFGLLEPTPTASTQFGDTVKSLILAEGEVSVESTLTKDVKVEDNGSADEWSSVDKSQAGEVLEINKQSPGKPAVNNKTVPPEAQ